MMFDGCELFGGSLFGGVVEIIVGEWKTSHYDQDGYEDHKCIINGVIIVSGIGL